MHSPRYSIFRGCRTFEYKAFSHQNRVMMVVTHTSEISPNNCLDRQDFSLPHKHRSSFEYELVLVYLLWHFIDVCRNEMIWDVFFEEIEPKERNPCNNLSLSGYSLHCDERVIIRSRRVRS